MILREFKVIVSAEDNEDAKQTEERLIAELSDGRLADYGIEFVGDIGDLTDLRKVVYHNARPARVYCGNGEQAEA